MKIGGKIYGIPSLKDNCYIISLIYNAEMADALGLDMESVEYTNWRQLEPFLTEVVQNAMKYFPNTMNIPCAAVRNSKFPTTLQLKPS